MGVEELTARPPGLGDLGPERVAHAAGLELDRGRARAASAGVAGGRVDGPVDVGALVEPDGEPVVAPTRVRRPAGPGDVRRAGAVAGLAADVDLGPARGEAVRGCVVVAADVRRVTLGAHVVPVLVPAGPVLRAAGRRRVGRVEVEPVLPALLLRPRVPRDPERLQAAVGEADQVLLQRVDAERVADLEVGRLPGRPIGVDPVTAVAAEEGGGDASLGEAGAAEVAEDGASPASCIARACCESRHAADSPAWQPAQAALPT